MGSPLTRYNLGLFNSGTYTPHIADISDITQESSALITTTDDHTYVLGQEVQFFIPQQWGMRQLNNQIGYVTALVDVDQFRVDINTTNYDPFVVPSPPAFVVIDPAQVAGIGDSNTGQSAPGGVLPVPNTVPGAFLNEPPT